MISALPLEGLWLSVCMSNHFEIMSDKTLCSRISLPKDPNNCRSVQAIVIPCSYVFLLIGIVRFINACLHKMMGQTSDQPGVAGRDVI